MIKNSNVITAQNFCYEHLSITLAQKWSKTKPVTVETVGITGGVITLNIRTRELHYRHNLQRELIPLKMTNSIRFLLQDHNL